VPWLLQVLVVIQFLLFSQPQPLAVAVQIGYRVPHQLHWQAPPVAILLLARLLDAGVLLRLLLLTAGVLLRLLLETAGVLLAVPPDGATARPVLASMRPGHKPLARRLEAIWAIAALVLV
jgi:hypothetical protein